MRARVQLLDHSPLSKQYLPEGFQWGDPGPDPRVMDRIFTMSLRRARP